MTDNFSLLSLALRRPGKIKGVTTMDSNAIWANLLGTWHDLEAEDPGCTIEGQPLSALAETADLWELFNRDKEDSMYQLTHVRICFQNYTYSVSPILIEVVGRRW